MKASSKDKAEGTLHQVKGSVKEAAGKLFDNTEREVEGKIEKAGGKMQEQVGRAKKVFGK